MALHTIPNEILLEISKLLLDSDLNNLIRTHSEIHVFLQPELHKRAVRDRTDCERSGNRWVRHRFPTVFVASRETWPDACDCEPFPAMIWAMRQQNRRLTQYLLDHNASGKSENGYWQAIPWLIEIMESADSSDSDYYTDTLLSLLQHAQRLAKDRNILSSQVTDLLQYWLGYFGIQGETDDKVWGFGACPDRDRIWDNCYEVGSREIETLELLLELGANPMHLSNSNIRWPYDTSTQAVLASPVPHVFRAQSPRLLTVLINNGVDLSWASDAGNILCHAVDNFHLPMVKTLLEAGMDPNDGQAGDSISPLNRTLEALGQGHIVDRRMIAEILLQHGANPNIPYVEKDYPIHKVVAHPAKNFSLMSPNGFALLLSLCEDLNVLNRKGKTALHIVMEAKDSWKRAYGIIPYPALLMEAGADPTARDISGNTPLECFLEKTNFGIGNFLAYGKPSGWGYQDTYRRLHFWLHHALKLNRLDLIPAQVVYDQARSEHVLKKFPREVPCPFSGLQSHIRSQTVKLFLDVKFALESSSRKDDAITEQFSEFWDMYRDEITLYTPGQDGLKWNVRRKYVRECQSSWKAEQWKKWREGEGWKEL